MIKGIFRLRIIWLVFVYLLSILSLSAAASEVTEYNFVIYDAEGQFDIYNVSLNWKTKEGRFCYMNTELSNVPDEVSILLYNKKNWTDVIDIEQYDHVCSSIKLYLPSGWFFTQRMDYHEFSLRFFFTGDIDKKSMEGYLYSFISDRNEPSSEKKMKSEYFGNHARQHELSVRGVRKKD